MSSSGGHVREERPPRFENSVKLRLPKFSKGYTQADFIKALDGTVERAEIRVLGRLKFPNEWTMTLSTAEVKDRVLQLGRFTVRGKKCVVYPQAENEIRGKIHWLPGEIDDEKIVEILKRFGEIVTFKKDMVFRSPVELQSTVRSFSLVIKSDVKIDDIPHFINVCKSEGLVTIKGRDPICLGCREHGHKKSECPDTDGNPFKSKKPFEENPVGGADSAKPKKKKKKLRRKPQRNAPTISAGDVATIEESITSFIEEMNQTLSRLKISTNQGSTQPSSSSTSQSNASAIPAVPSGSSQGQERSANQSKSQAKKVVKPSLVSAVVGAMGGSEQTANSNKKSASQQTEEAQLSNGGDVPNGIAIPSSDRQVTCDVTPNAVKSAVNGTVLIGENNVVNGETEEKSVKRKRNKKKKKVAFSSQA